MNNRIREKIRATLMREKPDYVATLRSDNESPFLKIVCVPQDQVEEYKAKYGDRLNVWFFDEE